MRRSLRARAFGALCLTALLAATPPDAPVADAAMRGETETVRQLLKDGADVNAAQGDGMTALHWAAEGGNVPMVDMLVYAGANTEAVTRLGAYTPMHLAARNGRVEVVAALLKAGAAADAVTSTGATALHLAAKAGRPESVVALLDAGAELNAKEGAWQQTPLIFAADAGRLEVVKVLLARGADPSTSSRAVNLPDRESVDRAAAERREQVLEAFRAQAEDPANWQPDPSQVQAAVRAAQEVQRTLETAAAVEARLEAGGELTAGFSGSVGSMGGLTPLLHAVREGHADVALALVEGGADINQPSAGDETTPLLMATINGQFDLALALLERGADPNLESIQGATPLFTAINTHWAPKTRYPQQHAYMVQQATYLDVMKALLEKGADPDARTDRHLWYMGYTFDQLSIDTQGATAFWRAAYATDVPAMKLLIEYGADPNIPTEVPDGGRRRRRAPAGPDPSGLAPAEPGGPAIYPIHAASGVGYGEGFAGNAHRHAPDAWLPSVQYLVEVLGADVNARDANGYNAIHHAAARGDNELIEYLVSKGGDVMAVSRRGQSTVDMANGPTQRIQPFPETIALLESLGAKKIQKCVSC